MGGYSNGSSTVEGDTKIYFRARSEAPSCRVKYMATLIDILLKRNGVVTVLRSAIA